MNLLDLPVDILYLVLPYLDVPSFVAFTSTCQALHDPGLAEYSLFWSSAIQTTFRVPNQPVVENDGKRWHQLYKRLRTQSKLFTWGNNEKGCLGHSYEHPAQLMDMPPAMRRRRALLARHVSWPTQMDDMAELGIVADMQCGGWSTTLLTSKGVLYSVGVLNGMQFNQRRSPYMQQIKIRPERLHFPPGFPHPIERYDPATAVRQFSSGRSHVLALSDSGRIWSWDNTGYAALNVKFLTVELREGVQSTELGAVRKVVAGWNKSAALINGAGIVVWDTLSRSHDEGETEDAALVLETAVVPGSSFQQLQRQRRGASTYNAGLESGLGEVLNFICLEQFVVFNTHLGKVFASKITWTPQLYELSPAVEIPIPALDHRQSLATDVQGSYKKFAIFTDTGAVLTGDQDHLHALFDSTPQANTPFPSPLARIPALQNSRVISLAFGDHHFHALHAAGHITSYGCESQGCGSLGLGGHSDPEGRLRGLRYAGMGGDGQLVPHAYAAAGRQVWFEAEKRAWIRFLASGGHEPDEARERMRMCGEVSVQGEVSEWVEQEGRAWEEKIRGPVTAGREFEDEDGDWNGHEDGLSAYFALSVAAAGWHSGALVLVDEARARKISKACIVPPEPPAPEPTLDDHNNNNNNNNNVDDTTPADQSSSTGLLATAVAWGSAQVRWFLGMPDRTTQTQTQTPQPPAPFQRSAFADPVRYGAAPKPGVEYVWADDFFPRLRLADGREMPGSAPFAEWRTRRPEWGLLGAQV